MDLEKVLKKTQARKDGLTASMAKRGRGRGQKELRIATDERPYDNDLLPEGERTRVQPGYNQGSEGPLPGYNQGSTRVQPGFGRTLTRVQPGSGSSLLDAKQGSEEPLPENSRQVPEHKGAQPGFNQGSEEPQSGLNQGTTRVQKSLNLGTPGYNQGSEEPQPGYNQGSEEPRPGYNQGSEECEPGFGSKPVKGRVPRLQKCDLPRASAQLDILVYLRRSLTTEGGTTPYLSRGQIAKDCHCSPNTVKTSIRRLMKKGLIASVARSFAPTHGGAIYTVPKNVSRWLDEDTQHVSNQGSEDRLNQGSEGGVVSSSFKTTTNRTEADEEAEELRDLVERFGLDSEELRIGANDLADALRKTEMPMAKFAQSVEHMAFYLNSPDAASLRHRKAYCLSRLRRGFYPEPAGFVSLEEQQLSAELEASKARMIRLKTLRREALMVEFQTWKLELSAERRAEIFRGTVVTPGSAMADSYLRDVFASENGHTDLLAMLDDDDSSRTCT